MDALKQSIKSGGGRGAGNGGTRRAPGASSAPRGEGARPRKRRAHPRAITRGIRKRASAG